MARSIASILDFRTDVSPFLVHLTRTSDGIGADERLKSILQQNKLVAGETLVSAASYGLTWPQPGTKWKFFQAVCFTETPLAQIHSLLEIAGRLVNLEPYGLVFLRAPLQMRGVSPVIYFNNEGADKDTLIHSLAKLIDTEPQVAAQIVPLVSVFGRKLKPGGTGASPVGRHDFLWEREWRWPKTQGDFEFKTSDIFVGLCPHDEIYQFQKLLPLVRFVDPRRTMRWYSSQLQDMKKRCKLTGQVV